MKKINKVNVLHSVKNVSLVVLGTLILTFGTSLFIIPFDLIVGGVSSIAIILDKLIPFEFFTIEILVTIITWVLFFLGWIFLGTNFALKTLVSTFVYPLGIAVFSKLVDPKVLNGFFCLKMSEYSQVSILLAALFGGLSVGCGCAVAFLGGGSTGGVDIIAFLICKAFKRLKSSAVIFSIDAISVIVGMFINKDFILTLLGIISAFITAVTIDKVFLGQTKAFIAQVISKNYEEINQAVLEKLDRTTSIVNIEGGYSREKKKMLIISFTINQYNELINIVNKIDKTAFITINSAHEINGEGFTW